MNSQGRKPLETADHTAEPRRGGRCVRPAFTLIELLVAMAVIIVLASIALLVVPDIMDKDRTTDGAGLVRQWLMIAKARAGRDGQPRGLRLLVDPSKPAGQKLFVTECQYIEQPPPYIPTNPAYGQTDINAPQVKFVYSFDSAGNLVPNSQQCWIDNLLPGDAALIQNGISQGTCWLSIRSLPAGSGMSSGFYAKILALNQQPGTAPGTFKLVAAAPTGLDNFPDASNGLGAAGTAGATNLAVYTTYGFAIILPPRPLLGEPPLPLPKNICIDLNQNVSYPAQANVSGDYDIVFTPTGHVFPTGAGASADGQMYLWVRDYTKVADMSPATTNPFTYNPALQQFPNGGEQQLVAIKTRSGSLGQFPVLWPNPNGQYNQIAPGVYENPYWLALQGATNP